MSLLNVLRFGGGGGGRFYDLLGLLSSFTIRIKMLFQVLCVEKTHWDSYLTETHKAKVLKIVVEPENLNQSREKRALAPSKFNSVRQEIHGTQIATSLHLISMCLLNVLRFGGRFYDLLGLLSSFTIRIKMLFQVLCVEKTHWDS